MYSRERNYFLFSVCISMVKAVLPSTITSTSALYSEVFIKYNVNFFFICFSIRLNTVML